MFALAVFGWNLRCSDYEQMGLSHWLPYKYNILLQAALRPIDAKRFVVQSIRGIGVLTLSWIYPCRRN